MVAAKVPRFVSYYRVSTDKQGASGLGLEAQRTAVTNYLNGGQWKLIEEFTEVESGKRSDRPELAKALRLCRAQKATLIIAKLDRLARNVYFISGLMESKVDFVAVDFPQANKLTVHILAAVAEHEAAMISQRTKDALAAAKARGVKLGGTRGEWRIASQAEAGAAASATTRRQQIQKRNADIIPVIEELRGQGVTKLRDIAERLNALGYVAPWRGVWHPNTVRRLIASQPPSLTNLKGDERNVV
jgi:DNA invertase Pin-like site-specific DNA recombinase